MKYFLNICLFFVFGCSATTEHYCYHNESLPCIPRREATKYDAPGCLRSDMSYLKVARTPYQRYVRLENPSEPVSCDICN